MVEQIDDLYQQGGSSTLMGLEAFDREREQISVGWKWTQAQSPSYSIDILLLRYTDATVYLGDMRHDRRQERIPYLETALSAARRLGDEAAAGTIFGNLGLAYADIGDPRQAIVYYEQALEISQRLDNRDGIARDLGNLASAYIELGDRSAGATYLDQALVVARELGDQVLEEKLLRNCYAL